VPSARGNSTRLELRSPDPSCNPYLALAAILRAGLAGITENLSPPDAVNVNIYHMSADERKTRGIDSLPSTLFDALSHLMASPLMQDALGGHVYEKFLIAKQLEWDRYRMHVSDWEIDSYLSRY
jgi:glutamine synthetase